MSKRPKLPHLKWLLLLTVAMGGTAFAVNSILGIGVQPDGRIMVPTGQQLTPTGTHIEVSDRPLGMALNASGTLLAVVTGSNFNPRSLHLIDVHAKTR